MFINIIGKPNKERKLKRVFDVDVEYIKCYRARRYMTMLL